MYYGTMVNISPVLTFSEGMTSHDLIRKIHICVPKPFDPDVDCETSVDDVLTTQQFQDCITTDPSTTQAVSAQKSHKEKNDWGKGVKTSVFKSKWKNNRLWLDFRRVEQDDHMHHEHVPLRVRKLTHYCWL
jgi:hypothetical protein